MIFNLDHDRAEVASESFCQRHGKYLGLTNETVFTACCRDVEALINQGVMEAAASPHFFDQNYKYHGNRSALSARPAFGIVGTPSRSMEYFKESETKEELQKLIETSIEKLGNSTFKVVAYRDVGNGRVERFPASSHVLEVNGHKYLVTSRETFTVNMEHYGVNLCTLHPPLKSMQTFQFWSYDRANGTFQEIGGGDTCSCFSDTNTGAVLWKCRGLKNVGYHLPDRDVNGEKCDFKVYNHDIMYCTYFIADTQCEDSALKDTVRA